MNQRALVNIIKTSKTVNGRPVFLATIPLRRSKSSVPAPLTSENLYRDYTPNSNVKFGQFEDYISAGIPKYENPNNKLDLEYFDWANGNMHYYYAGTGAAIVVFLCASAVAFSFACLAWYSYADKGEVKMSNVSIHPYFGVKNGAIANTYKFPFYTWLMVYTPQPASGRTLFYEEIEWAINERRRLDGERKKLKRAISEL